MVLIFIILGKIDVDFDVEVEVVVIICMISIFFEVRVVESKYFLIIVCFRLIRLF